MLWYISMKSAPVDTVFVVHKTEPHITDTVAALTPEDHEVVTAECDPGNFIGELPPDDDKIDGLAEVIVTAIELRDNFSEDVLEEIEKAVAASHGHTIAEWILSKVLTGAIHHSIENNYSANDPNQKRELKTFVIQYLREHWLHL